jgi:hypothetical protein
VRRMRRRTLALVLAVSALIPAIGPASAHTPDLRVVLYTGNCQLRVTFHFTQPIGFGSLTNPGYSLEVQPAAPCVLTDDPIDPLRTTEVIASGSSSLFDCNSAVGSGSWSQWWRKSNGVYSPAPVDGGRHKVFGTWDNWVMETEGPSVVTFAGAIHLRLDPLWASHAAIHCSNNTLWELHTIGTQVFEDPQP